MWPLMAIVFIVVAFATQAASAGIPYNVGDVFAGRGDGKVDQYSPTGTFIQRLETTSASTEETGMCFEGSGNLLTTNWSAGNVTKFNNAAVLLTHPWGGPFSSHPETCAVDMAGNIYVGEVDGLNRLQKFNSAGTQLAFWNPTVEDRGIDWIDLAADQCTMYYTSEGDSVQRFNVCTGLQLTNFSSGLAGPCYALRIRTGGDVMVACTNNVFRLNSSGAVVQTYAASTYPGASFFFALNIDPDGTSFWTADYYTGNIYRINIATGALVTTFNAPIFLSLAGLSIFGEHTVGGPPPPPTDTTPPICDLIRVDPGPPTRLYVRTQDSGSGLASIVVTEQTNATVTWPPFTPGTTNQVTVTGTKINQNRTARVALRVTDVAGNVTLCDPILAKLRIGQASKTTQTYAGLPRAESKVRVTNLRPGVKSVALVVNGKQFRTIRLAPGARQLINVARAMRPGNRNRITVIARGARGASVSVVISD